MLRVGLTGGIACGKSTVVAILREQGCAVLEADPVAHKMIERSGAAYAGVIREFGEGICAPDGAVDRRKLAAIVFADPARLKRLNQIVHPHVLRLQDAQLAAWQELGLPLGIIEAPLMIEAGYHKKVDRLTVCWCRPEQQLERLTARGLTEEQARARIAAQMPIEEKRRLADDQIDCSGTLERTREQTLKLVSQWRSFASGKK